MAISFNSQGNLHKTIDFTIEEVYHHFVTNSRRKKLLDNSIPFFRHFSHCGCTTAYVGGSFASIKPKPGDIDLCFDLNQVDLKKLECVSLTFSTSTNLGRSGER
ncbi:hypothetical protein [Paraflavitalea sp. CAU 1676]|uniref:DUF6932 family protein n=1 Tax=Paraflavitalea sp. CAU 1676 TaxID=3032598 RepID=UPI0023D9C3DE|nr:hypothetical protein [Paraflavitalea sp. CAU 1676]MDF2190729.1 hypothetical protein [Paraflavitalea sp. CAU 1676]